ncbi:MAG: response regulator [Candidatus Sulfotelmatobacter sp.]
MTWPGQQPAKGELGWQMKHTILIVDDSPLIRRSLRSWIDGTVDWEVCGEAENGKEAVEKVEELRPDIVILDLQMPVMNGLEAARRIRDAAPRTAMLMFTVHTSGELLKAALEAGVTDVVSKSDRFSDHLSAALRQIVG